MFRAYLQSFLQTPQRLWAYSKHHPYESIGYGSVLLFLALAAKVVIVAAAGVAIVGGIYWMFHEPR
ncbi:hypothetical protein ACQ4N7_24855 [Nodosilinea sp. AN01ver1]|uniref:hypothetical protein n=1 Tax=Nodosilinea sp. AN01ver1 TaxID=3423362 RepID=UPI003D319B0C